MVTISAFSKIRVIADERVGSGTGVRIRLTQTEGTEAIAVLDTIALTPGTTAQRVYDVPGTHLTIFADAVGGSGSDGVDVLVYGA